MKKISTYFSCISIMIGVMSATFLLAGAFNLKILKSTSTSTSDYSSLSNKKIAWGIKRADNHDQPDVGKENVEVMDEIRKTINEYKLIKSSCFWATFFVFKSFSLNGVVF